MTIDVRAALLEAARHELREHGAAEVSLRAVARRAGVSHAAPKHHFGDRAGLLTAVAVEGHGLLRAQLEHADPGDVGGRVAALGRAYLEFGLDHPALMELMFRTDQLHPGDDALVTARESSLRVLIAAIGDGSAAPGSLALIAWAFVHGLVVLLREGALDSAAPDPRALAFSLVEEFTTLVQDARP